MSVFKQWNDDDYLTPGEVAAILRVDPKTVTRWAASGKIPDFDGVPSVIRTFGGHHRYRFKVIRMMTSGQVRLGYGGVVEVESAAEVTK